MTEPIRLPPELTRETAAELRAALLGRLQGTDLLEGTLVLDASRVGAVDAAGLQVLLALAASLRRDGGRLAVVGASEVFRAACRTLGVHELADAPGA